MLFAISNSTENKPEGKPMAKDVVAEFVRPIKKSHHGSGVEHVAQDLSDHFFNTPEAGDTFEGIADWWIARQRRKNADSVVRSALDRLVEEGRVIKRLYGERELYVSSWTEQ